MGERDPIQIASPHQRDKVVIATDPIYLSQQVRFEGCQVRGFRAAGNWILLLYYQGLRLGWIDEVPGLPGVSPDLLRQMADQLQARAILFESDRQGRTERNLFMLELIAKFAPQAAPQATEP